MASPHPLSTLRWVLWLLTFLFAFLLFRPWLEDWWVSQQAEPRAVTARGSLADDELNTIKIFDSVSPSVVYITTTKRVIDPWSRNVYQVPRGTGSGLIWDRHGHVVTNWHVVENAQSAKVRLSDQRSYSAQLVGVSADHDLAVLRINVPLDAPPAVPIGTSDDLRVGQKVFAIGNPFGLDYTLTTGVISALDRSIGADNGATINHLIQTDAAINPGNSGGPLIDSAGRLIGINTAIYSESGAYAGIAFAVPVDTVNRVVPKLIANGRYVRPVIGIETDDDISAVIGKKLGVSGIVILTVREGSAADAAGLRGTQTDKNDQIYPGDIILKINQDRIEEIADLADALDKYQIGDVVKLTIWREGKELKIGLKLGT